MSTHFIAQLVRNAVEKQRPFDALAAIINLQPVDVADVLAQLKPAQAWALLQELPERAQVFACFAPELQMRIAAQAPRGKGRSEEHTSELQSRFDLVCRLLLEKKNR